MLCSVCVVYMVCYAGFLIRRYGKEGGLCPRVIIALANIINAILDRGTINRTRLPRLKYTGLTICT